jgi:hypothetical protein
MFGPIPVVFVSPLSRGECQERFRDTTERQGSLWYLTGANIGKKAPRFRGRADSELHIAQFEETLGRNSFVPFLDARLVPILDGGTEINGSIGLSKSVRRFLSVLLTVGGLILTAILVVGVVQLAQGHLSPGIPFVVGFIGFGGFGTLVFRSGSRSFHSGIPSLITDVASLVDCGDPPDLTDRQGVP